MTCLCEALFFFFFQAEDGIRDLVRSRGLGDVYKRQRYQNSVRDENHVESSYILYADEFAGIQAIYRYICLLYTSDAADERSSVDLGGRRIIKKKKNIESEGTAVESREKNAEKKKIAEIRNNTLR